MRLGAACSTEGFDPPGALAQLGPGAVARVVLDLNHDGVPGWHAIQGRSVVGTLARETCVSLGLDPSWADLGAAAAVAWDHWGHALWALEVGNEPDGLGASSWTMTADRFVAGLWSACSALHHGQHERPLLISGGQLTWQPGFIGARSLPPCIWLGMHDYDSSLDGYPAPPPAGGHHDLSAALDAMSPLAARTRGIALTEVGTTRLDAAYADDYLGRVLGILGRHPAVELLCWFPFCDRQDRSVLGLVGDDGVARPALHRLAAAIAGPAAPSLSQRQRLALFAAPGSAGRGRR